MPNLRIDKLQQQYTIHWSASVCDRFSTSVPRPSRVDYISVCSRSPRLNKRNLNNCNYMNPKYNIITLQYKTSVTNDLAPLQLYPRSPPIHLLVMITGETLFTHISCLNTMSRVCVTCNIMLEFLYLTYVILNHTCEKIQTISANIKWHIEC